MYTGQGHVEFMLIRNRLYQEGITSMICLLICLESVTTSWRQGLVLALNPDSQPRFPTPIPSPDFQS